MDTQLIPVFDGTVNNEPTLLCNARDLHAFLEVGCDFSSWVKRRISEYGFKANLDYIEFSSNLRKTAGGRPARDYHLTLDTAKETAMVERNEKG
ncbi:TPA: antA/AntB antirepressor family protein, partial [Salmonella enterica subsp. enterica serovar Muenchen]